MTASMSTVQATERESVHSPQHKRKRVVLFLGGSKLYGYYNRAPNVQDAMLQLSHLLKTSLTLASLLAAVLYSTMEVCQLVDYSTCYIDNILAHQLAVQQYH